MKLERSKNAIRNIVWGLINRVVTLLFPFVIRTILIYTLGSEYLGLNSLFTSILTVLNLAELGFSTAIVFSMYKPIAENDSNMICALMAYYKKVYLVIGIAVFTVGMVIMPFLPRLISGSYPDDINLYGLYLLFLVNTSISYFLFAYKVSILTAYQREDILSKVDVVLRIVTYSLQALILLRFGNYYAYVIINIAYTVLNNIVCAFISDKKYPQYKCKGQLSKAAKNSLKKNISGLVIGKICLVSRNSFDNIFISAFLGLQIVAIYGNYYYIMSAIVGILGIFMTAISAGVGNSVVAESVEKNYKDMNKINFIYEWIAGWCTICLFCLYQPFMKIWMGEDMLFPTVDVILICLYFYSLSMGDVRSKYSHAAGLFWESRYYVLAEAIVNIILNYFLGKIFGVSGIILATIVTIVTVNYIWGSHIVFKYYFKQYKIINFFMKNLLYFLVTVIGAGVTFGIVHAIPDKGIGMFLVKGAICLIIPNVFFLICYSKTAVFKDAKEMIIRILRKR